jgi:uncharacterized repeat protein (TIGR01451 family)
MEERNALSSPGRVGLVAFAITCGVLLAISVALAQSPPNFEDSYKTGTSLTTTGDVVTYTIVAINTGGPVSVTLSDPVPVGSTFIPGSCTYWSSGGTPQSCDPPPDLWQEDNVSGRITTTFAVEVTAGTMGWPLENCATLDWGTDQQEICHTTTVGYLVYLPFVARNFVPAPDLIVSNVTAAGTDIEVVITNQGSAPVDEAFWVDLYVNPDRPPTAVNEVWSTLGDEGIAWGVTEPLDVGESLTLTPYDAYYSEGYSDFTGSVDPGAEIYAQVDSASIGREYGGVLEDHEILDTTYNNIWPTYDGSATSVTPSVTTANEPSAVAPERMPPRP